MFKMTKMTTIQAAQAMLNSFSFSKATPLVFFFFIMISAVVFSIILFIKNKEAFIAYYTGIIMLSVFFAYMIHKHTLFHAFTFNHFITIFLVVLIFFSVVFGIFGIATIDE